MGESREAATDWKSHKRVNSWNLVLWLKFLQNSAVICVFKNVSSNYWDVKGFDGSSSASMTSHLFLVQNTTHIDNLSRYFSIWICMYQDSIIILEFGLNVALSQKILEKFSLPEYIFQNTIIVIWNIYSGNSPLSPGLKPPLVWSFWERHKIWKKNLPLKVYATQ